MIMVVSLQIEIRIIERRKEAEEIRGRNPLDLWLLWYRMGPKIAKLRYKL